MAPFHRRSVGGWLGDKIKSVSTVVGVSLAVAVIMVIAFMLMPAGSNANILIVLTLAAGILTYMAAALCSHPL